MSENYYPITFDAESSFTINNSGTAPAPCKVTVIPKVDLMLFTLQGLSDTPITVSQVHANDVLIIDGETGIVTINDTPAYDKYNGWEFPKLKTGINKVIIPNGASVAVSIEFNARYI